MWCKPGVGTEGDAIAAPRFAQDRRVDDAVRITSLVLRTSVIYVKDVGEGDVHACFDAGVQAGEQVGVGVTAFGFEFEESGKIKVICLILKENTFSKDISACGGKVYARREPPPLHTQERVYVERFGVRELQPGNKECCPHPRVRILLLLYEPHVYF